MSLSFREVNFERLLGLVLFERLGAILVSKILFYYFLFRRGQWQCKYLDSIFRLFIGSPSSESVLLTHTSDQQSTSARERQRIYKSSLNDFSVKTTTLIV